MEGPAIAIVVLQVGVTFTFFLSRSEVTDNRWQSLDLALGLLLLATSWFGQVHRHLVIM